MLKTFYCRFRGSRTGAYALRCHDRITAKRAFCLLHELPESTYVIISSRPAAGITYASSNCPK